MRRPFKKTRTIAVRQAEKHNKNGFTSLETLSIWNGKINKNKDSDFECKKESLSIDVTYIVDVEEQRE